MRAGAQGSMGTRSWAGKLCTFVLEPGIGLAHYGLSVGDVGKRTDPHGGLRPTGKRGPASVDQSNTTASIHLSGPRLPWAGRCPVVCFFLFSWLYFCLLQNEDRGWQSSRPVSCFLKYERRRRARPERPDIEPDGANRGRS